MRIRKFKKKDTEQVARVIKSTFLKYNGSEGGKESVLKYVSRYSRDNISTLADQFENNPIVLVATENEKIMGIIRGDEHKVFQLFVEGNYHGKGVGRKLMERFEERAKDRGSSVIRLRSSLYAVNFYEHLGYRKTTGVRTSQRFGDIRYQPMAKSLK